MKIYSYYMITMPYANAHVEFFVDKFSCLRKVQLYSFSTLMLDLTLNRSNQNGVLKVCYPVNCSSRTARHINRFTIELFGENKYHELKKNKKGDLIECEDILSKAVEMFERYSRDGKVY